MALPLQLFSLGLKMTVRHFLCTVPAEVPYTIQYKAPEPGRYVATEQYLPADTLVMLFWMTHLSSVMVLVLQGTQQTVLRLQILRWHLLLSTLHSFKIKSMREVQAVLSSTQLQELRQTGIRLSP